MSPSVDGSPADLNPISATSKSPREKWLISFTVLFGSVMVLTDVSIVNVALPHLMGAFAETQSSITWIATSYIIAAVISLTMAGWLCTVFGRKRVYLGCFLVFIGASVLAGAAQSFGQMLFARTLQGLGGGSLIPISLAIVRETFLPRERPMAMAFYGMALMAGSGSAPVLGGWIIEHYGWPWIFYINLPAGVLGLYLVKTHLKDPSYLKRGLKRIDWTGILLLTIGLITTQIVLERGQANDWFESKAITLGALIGTAALLALVFQQLRSPQPVFNLRLLGNGPLSAGCVIGITLGTTYYGTTFMLPQFTQNLLGYPPLQSGIALLPRVIAHIMFMPLAGWMYPRIGPRISAILGSLLQVWSFHELSKLSLEVGLSTLAPILMLTGLALPFIHVAVSTATFDRIPREDMTEASSLFSLSFHVGANLGYAVMSTVIARRSQFHRLSLISHISLLNPAFLESRSALREWLGGELETGLADERALALTDSLVNAQASVLAYNDVAWLLGALTVAAIPFCFLFKKAKLRTDATVGSAIGDGGDPSPSGEEKVREVP